MALLAIGCPIDVDGNAGDGLKDTTHRMAVSRRSEGASCESVTASKLSLKKLAAVIIPYLVFSCSLGYGPLFAL